MMPTMLTWVETKDICENNVVLCGGAVMRLFMMTALAIMTIAVNDAGNIEKPKTQQEMIVEITFDVGEQYGISPYLLQAIIYQESGGNPDVCADGCFGLMGISSYWNRDRMERLGVNDLYDPYQNILVGADLLSEIEDALGEDATLENVLMAYSAGMAGARDAIRQGLVSRYATQVIDRMDEYERAAQR